MVIGKGQVPTQENCLVVLFSLQSTQNESERNACPKHDCTLHNQVADCQHSPD